MQITASPGYHAHPEWSPRGDKIAFIRGVPPATATLPSIPDALMLVDVATGREEQIATPFQASGTVAWSPDGTRIVVPLLESRRGATIFEADVASRKVRSVQELPGRYGDTSAWVDLAWNPKRNEIVFGSQRRDTPQIWSMPAGGPPVMIQMPLTKYLPADIILLQKLSALPDGSGVVYSADAVNGAGNYELYRIGAAGGKPVNLTNTVRDEFDPAVSPDGRRIALVSNQMGNADLFTMPAAGGANKHVRITNLKFRQPSGHLRVKVLDELGSPTPVRLYVRASDSKAYCPVGSPIFYYFLDPGHEREGFFIGSGDDVFPVPAGKVELFAVKGVEYEIASRTVNVGGAETAEITIQMQRWTNWNQRGWYSGENHFHANYNGLYYQKPQDSLRWLEAMDLNTANMIVANALGAFIHDKEFFRGRPDPLSTSRYILCWGEEYRNSYPLGHMLFLNLTRLVPPFFTSVIGGNSPYDFPLNTTAAIEARKQGGLVSYAHPTSGGRDVFDTNLGSKEAPVGAALGALDAFDILPYGPSAFAVWYSLLNCGFRISPGAGTDVFTNWRGIRLMPGGDREYVEVGPVFTWDRWIARYRAGRAFVTNGPLLTFHVNGEPMGSVIKVPEGGGYRARLSAEITSRVPIESVEFIRDGKVIESRDVSAESQPVQMDAEVMVERSCWFAVRVTGRRSRGVYDEGGVPSAHSAAVYVDVGGKPTLVKDDLALMVRWVDRLWALLEERNNFGPGNNRETARKMILDARGYYQTRLAMQP